jgi:tetratricopeptide (TPR) repeat protein
MEDNGHRAVTATDLEAAPEGADGEEMEDDGHREEVKGILAADEAEFMAVMEELEDESFDESFSVHQNLNHYCVAIDRYPNDARLRCCRASIFLDLEDWDAAEEDATAALTLRPSYVKSLLFRSIARLEQENARGALDDVEAGLALDATNSELLCMKDKALEALTARENKLRTTFKNAQAQLAKLKKGDLSKWPGGIQDLHSNILRHKGAMQEAHDALVECNPLWAEYLRIPKAGKKNPKDKLPGKNEIHRVFQSYCDRVEDAMASSSLPQKDRAKQLLLEDWDKFNPKSM